MGKVDAGLLKQGAVAQNAGAAAAPERRPGRGTPPGVFLKAGAAIGGLQRLRQAILQDLQIGKDSVAGRVGVHLRVS